MQEIELTHVKWGKKALVLAPFYELLELYLYGVHEKSTRDICCMASKLENMDSWIDSCSE